VPYELKRASRETDTAGAEAALIGEDLRSARIAMGLSVADMAAQLRIRRPYLEALEEGRLRDLPGPAYAVGFVRTYAGALGLDADSATRRFRELVGPGAPKPKLVFPEAVPERGMPAATFVVAGVVAVIGAYVAWFNWSGGGARSVDVVPPVPPRLETAAEQGRSQLPGREAAPGGVPAAALPPPGGLAAVATSGSNTSAQAATVPSGQPAAGAIPVTPGVAADSVPQALPALGVPDGTRVVLRAKANSQDGAWIQVRDSRSGQVLVNRVLRPGEVWAAPARDGLLLDTGKADGLDILLDSQPQPILEGVIGVRRNITLDPDRLRQRLAPATAAAIPRN
jgi:cytoskeleton protein RodZ